MDMQWIKVDKINLRDTYIEFFRQDQQKCKEALPYFHGRAFGDLSGLFNLDFFLGNES